MNLLGRKWLGRFFYLRIVVMPERALMFPLAQGGAIWCEVQVSSQCVLPTVVGETTKLIHYFYYTKGGTTNENAETVCIGTCRGRVPVDWCLEYNGMLY
jgi:hypothetical protein